MNIASNILGGGTFNQRDPCVSTWTNFSTMPLAISFSPNIFFSGGNAVFIASVLATSQGDIVDLILFGFMPTLGPVFFPVGIPAVLLNGIPAVAMMTDSLGNSMNASIMGVAFPSPTNVLLLLDESGTGRPLEGRVDADTVSAISRTLARGGESVRWATEGEKGLVRVEEFGWGAAAALRGALDALEREGATEIVIDLRGNPGGDVHAAIEAAGHFLTEGALIATLVDDDGDETAYRARAGVVCQLPLFILVDGQTASAAELFAGALAAHGRAVVVGPETAGKTTVQRIVPALDHGVAWESCARVLLPSGT
ncbi:MAG: S41 family peptidase [Polyangiaceae bacterium]